jgi:type II secretion system protein H
LRARRGVTLIEMLIVMIIIGMMAAVVIPRVGRGLASRELDRVSQQLALDLRTASQLAGRHRRPVQFQAVGTTGYRVVDKATPASVYISRNFGAVSKANATFGNLSNLDFYPNGITSGAVSFTVTVNGKSRTVTVTRVGHVRRL